MSKPLEGLRVLVTRPAEQAVGWRMPLEAAGATVLLHPTVTVRPPPSWAPLDHAFARLGDYDWLTFTSGAAARLALARLPSSINRATLTRPRIAAVGRETTRAIEAHGLAVALAPTDELAASLARALGPLPPGTRVLFPRAIGGRDDLHNALTTIGCIVDVVPASQTVSLTGLTLPSEFDVATFASPSAFRAFVDAHGVDPLRRATIAAIGPTTAAALAELGLTPIVASTPSIEALIDAIAAAYAHGDQ